MANTIATYVSFTSKNQILTFPSNLSFRVYYLESPLSLLGERIGIQFVNNLLSINGFHTGIGFQCTNKAEPYEFTYDEIVAGGFAINSLLPEIVDNDLVWNNTPEITQGSFIDKIYWERSTYLCTISSSQVVQIQNWILDVWLPNNPIYSLLSAIKSEAIDDVFNPIFRPSICDTFCYSLIYYIQNTNGGNQVDPVFSSQIEGLKGCIEYETVPNVSVNAFVSNVPNSIIPVDYEENKQEIINFYILFEQEINAVVNLEEEIQKLIAELETAPPEEKAALIRQIMNDLFTLLQVIRNIYSNFEVAYYYGYGIGDKNNIPQYWKITKPELTLIYTNSNLMRNYAPIDKTGNLVLDSLTLNLECNDCEEDKVIYWVIIITIIIILFLLAIVLIV